VWSGRYVTTFPWHLLPCDINPNLKLKIPRQTELRVYQLRGMNHKLRLYLHSLYCTPNIPDPPYRFHIAVCTKISVAVENVSIQWSHLFE